MKNLIACVLCFVLALSLAACGGRANSEDGTPTTLAPVGGDPATWGPAIETEEENVQIPNPWVECDSLEEAGKLAGFSFTAPETAL